MPPLVDAMRRRLVAITHVPSSDCMLLFGVNRAVATALGAYDREGLLLPSKDLGNVATVLPALGSKEVAAEPIAKSPMAFAGRGSRRWRERLAFTGNCYPVK